MGPPFLVARGISKSFGGAVALRNASLDIKAGEVHGLAGANGAGKSTLIKVLAGLHHQDSGSIEIDGVATRISSPQHAARLGMNFIHQELAFVPGMTVLQNIMLGVPKPARFGMIEWDRIASEVSPIARRVGITAPLHAGVKGLSTAEKWLVSICRALVRKARLIVMDEPTASLSAGETQKLLGIIKDLSSSGVSILYVSHRLDELIELCNRVSVFRDGQSVAKIDRGKLDRKALVEAIVGGAEHLPAVSGLRKTDSTDVVLKVRKLSRRPMVHEVSFELHRGEVLGIGGLVGAGRSELVRLIYGADRADGGVMHLEGKAYAPRSPAHAVASGFGLVPEERRAEGLVLSKSVAFNLNLASLRDLVFSRSFPILSRKAQLNLAGETIKALGIKARNADTAVGLLSGGNQQKVVVGRWLQRAPRILILDEPTRGVDVGARAEIHQLIRQLAGKGMSLIIISSEPDELPELCDRVVVMAEGKLVRELQGSELSRAAIIEASYARDEAPRSGVPS